MEPDDPRLDADFLTTHQLDEATVEAVGKLSEALETVEIARGHLYAFHQLSGHADFQVVEEYADSYYEPFLQLEVRAGELTRGKRHLHEAGLKRERRTPGPGRR